MLAGALLGDSCCANGAIQGGVQRFQAERNAAGCECWLLQERPSQGCKYKMPVIFETANLLVLPMPGMAGGTICPEGYRGGVINLFRGSHPTLLLSYGTKTRRKPMLLFRLSGLLLLRLADRQFSELLFQLPPRFTRFEPTTDALILQWPPWYCTHFFEILLHWRIQ